MNRDIKILYRLVLGLAIMVLVSVAFNVFAGVHIAEFSKQQALSAKHSARAASEQAQAQARAFAKAVQTSRYDGALVSCENTNTRHDNALQYSAALDKLNSIAGVIATDELNVLAPLRNGKNGRQTCAQYATSETELKLTALSAKPHG